MKKLVFLICLMVIKPCFADERVKQLSIRCYSGTCISVIGICGYHMSFQGYVGNNLNFYAETDYQGGSEGVSISGLSSSVKSVSQNGINIYLRSASVNTDHRWTENINFVRIVHTGPYSTGVENITSTTWQRDLYWYFYA